MAAEKWAAFFVNLCHSLTAKFYALEEKIAMEPFNPDVKPQIPDLNKPAPENEGFIQDHAKVVEVGAEAATVAGKRKVTEASTSGIKRFKGTAESASQANNDKGEDIIEIEDSEDEE